MTEPGYLTTGWGGYPEIEAEPNWYVAVRKTSDPDSWRLLLGPYKTKDDAEGKLLKAKWLFAEHQANAATLELYGLTWGTLAMKMGYDMPGSLNQFLEDKPGTSSTASTPEKKKGKP